MMQLPKNNINLKNYYRIEKDKIILGKKKYSCDSLMVISMILRFLSLFAIIFGILSCLQLGSYQGIILSLMGVMTLALGCIYKKIALETMEIQKRKITGIRKVLYKI